MLTKHEKSRIAVAIAESQASANAKWTPEQQAQVDAAIVKMARMVTLKHLIVASVLTAYTYALLYFTNQRKAKDDREHRPEN